MSDEPNLDRKSAEVLLKVADAAKRPSREDIGSARARFEERKQALRCGQGRVRSGYPISHHR